jgi:hypothetical protein
MEKFDKNQKILPGRAARPEFDARTRVGNWWRGGPIKPKAPLESSKAKKLKGTTPIVSSLSPTKAAQKLLDTDNRSVKKLRTALSAMVQHCSQLKAKLGTAASKIAHLSRLLASGDGGEGARAQEELECCQSSCQNADCSMQSHVSTKLKVVRELIGQGYDPNDTGRTLRRHRLAVMRALEKECGKDNTLKQSQVASAVVDMFKEKSTKKSLKQRASRDAVLKGLESTFAIIAARSNGNSRYTTKDREVRDALTTAIMMEKPDTVTINAMREALGNVVDWDALKTALARAAAFKENEGALV